MFNIHFLKKENSIPVIVTSNMTKPEPDFRGNLFQGLLCIIFYFFFLTTLYPGEIGHTNN